MRSQLFYCAFAVLMILSACEPDVSNDLATGKLDTSEKIGQYALQHPGSLTRFVRATGSYALYYMQNCLTTGGYGRAAGSRALDYASIEDICAAAAIWYYSPNYR
jgi:hypothetical protein